MIWGSTNWEFLEKITGIYRTLSECQKKRTHFSDLENDAAFLSLELKTVKKALSLNFFPLYLFKFITTVVLINRKVNIHFGSQMINHNGYFI